MFIPACCLLCIVMFVAFSWMTEVFSLKIILYGCDYNNDNDSNSYLAVRYGSETMTKISADEND